LAYDKPYDFYNNELTPEAVSEMLDDSYFTICDFDKRIVGFFCIGNSAQVPNKLYSYSNNFTDIGLGIRPDLTGKGYGTLFFSVILSYKKFGFRQEAEFIKGDTEFITMILRHIERGVVNEKR
jgi:RimJ/RimL family protein N-acetyltransferase